MIDYSIIIAAPVYTADLPVLASLRECQLDAARYEIIVALGHQPSRQRNAACARARGRVLLFLDSDCRITPDYLHQLDRQWTALEADVLGGPVLLEGGRHAPRLQRVFQTTFAHPLAVGATASRYASHGQPRLCGEAELILCNLAVKAEVFTREGGFNDALYPNEENEWLDRVAPRARVWHDPQLVVHRPQRATWEALIHTLLRYGAGRSRQALVTRRFTVKSLPLAGLLLWMAATWVARAAVSALTGLGALLYITLIAATAPGALLVTLGERLQVGLAALATLFFYATGQLLGLANWPAPHPRQHDVCLVNERGESLPAAS